MSGAVAIFVKTPGLSPVKTRLAAVLGQERAESFHLVAARAVQAVVQEACVQDTMDGYFAVAEQTALNHAYWRDLNCLWQGEGDLGERMAHIYQTLIRQHDFVILVGADIPQMTVSELTEAAAWLRHYEQARFYLSPSSDGGFWLFGGNRAVPLSAWTDVTYSVADTGQQFFRQISKLGEVSWGAELQDVDEAGDLPAVLAALLGLNEPMPAQRKVLQLLYPLSATMLD